MRSQFLMTNTPKSLDIGSKIIRDPIHGQIPLTQKEYYILQLPVMMRLDYIRQNISLMYAYPAMQTTRLIHSIGTMHLANKMLTVILDQLKKSGNCDDVFPNDEENTLIEIIRLAALLHDSGHGPLSHISEKLMLNTFKNYSNKKEQKEFKELFNIDDEITDEHSKYIHEYFSYKIITSKEITNIIKDERIAKQAASLIVKKPSKNYFTESGYIILKKIISSEIDADRLDYLLRDSFSSGVVYGIIDAHSIINNLKAIKKDDGEYDIAIDSKALSAVEHMINARFSMYKWSYHHHVAVVYDKIFEEALKYVEKEYPDFIKKLQWRYFIKGRMTDDEILSEIREIIGESTKGNKGEFELIKAIIDRRYKPLSLLKHTDINDLYKLFESKYKHEHQDKFIGEDSSKITYFIREKFDYNTTEILIKILEDDKNFKDLRYYILKEFIKDNDRSKKKFKRNNTTLLGIKKKKSPYTPLDKPSTINIVNGDEIYDILDISEQVKYTNIVWKNSQKFYLFLCAPYNTIEKLSHYIEKKKRDLLDLLADLLIELEKAIS